MYSLCISQPSLNLNIKYMRKLCETLCCTSIVVSPPAPSPVISNVGHFAENLEIIVIISDHSRSNSSMVQSSSLHPV